MRSAEAWLAEKAAREGCAPLDGAAFCSPRHRLSVSIMHAFPAWGRAHVTMCPTHANLAGATHRTGTSCHIWHEDLVEER
jgi:hypothetical protein